MKKQIIAAFAATGLAFSLVSPASAAVSFDPATGTGFVGKGDVKDALGLTEKQIQTQSDSINFFVTATETFEVECEVTEETITRAGSQGVGNGAHNGLGRKVTTTVIRDAVSEVDESVQRDVTGGTRKNPQMSVTGFNLLGYPADFTYTDGAAPALGDNCTGVDEDGSFQGQYVAVTSLGRSTPALNVKLGTKTALLPNTPVATTV